ncbi:hypothetical protein F511_26059 [Dorcoceras hygrometricum]|uniref:Uncharacterized protein n=1 Tax=Dorcoceras hygrometricum TaxID=472368 RepID=A0A2Z7CZZ2_9LAMI|nr:hypothetical protein F511_26059 [Dorcoceras hygrometricum]
MLTFYSLTPRQTSSVSLLMICSMVARYAPPISYNFLNLIHLEMGAKTIFEKRMGNIDDAVPFFGKGFNKIYPLIMVIYTILIASNFFYRIADYLGNWKIFKFHSEESDDVDGYDPSGLIILQKERSWLQEGHKVGELVVPLARSFSNATIDLESCSKSMVSLKTQMSPLATDDGHHSRSESFQHKAIENGIDQKYAGIRSHPIEQEPNLSSTTSDNSDLPAKASAGIASTWESMKTGFRSLKSNIEARRFIPLRQTHDSKHSIVSSSESLDEIFERLKFPNSRSNQL